MTEIFIHNHVCLHHGQIHVYAHMYMLTRPIAQFPEVSTTAVRLLGSFNKMELLYGLEYITSHAKV